MTRMDGRAVCPTCRTRVRLADRHAPGQVIACPACEASLVWSVECDGLVVAEEASSGRDEDGLTLRPLLVAIGASCVCLAVSGVAFYLSGTSEVAIRPSIPALVDRPADDQLPEERRNAAEDPDVSPAKSDWEEPAAVAPATEMQAKNGTLLPDPIVAPPAEPTRPPGGDDRSEASALAAQRMDEPILVPMASYDPEAEPISVVIDGALQARSEARLQAVLVRLETPTAVPLAKLLQTLSDLAAVPFVFSRGEVRGEVRTSAKDATVAQVLDEVLDAERLEWTVAEDGRVLIGEPR